VLFDLEPGVIDAARASLGELFRQSNFVNQNAGGATTGPRATPHGLGTNSSKPPCGVAAFVVNSEPRSGARSSVRMCVWGSSLLAVFIDHRDFGARAARPLCLSSPVDPHAGKYSDSL
jgi:hypothetical protein